MLIPIQIVRRFEYLVSFFFVFCSLALYSAVKMFSLGLEKGSDGFHYAILAICMLIITIR